MQGAICMCRHQQGAIALLALGLGILIGTVCNSTWLSIVLILGCFGLGCLCQKKIGIDLSTAAYTLGKNHKEGTIWNWPFNKAP